MSANVCHLGDCREIMRRLIAEGVKVQMCVTSPPYWGLRDYGVNGQLGLEPTPAEYVVNMVEVFRLVRDLLADDGTLWLNLGDSYAGSWGAQGHTGQMADRFVISARQIQKHPQFGKLTGNRGIGNGIKPKDLIGIPWRVAFALQADGWYLRQDIIWNKPNPMPESVRDRCTKAHEYLFLLSNRERYYFDQDGIKEPCVQDERRPTFRGGAYVNNATFDNAVGGKSTVVGNVRRQRKPAGWDTGPGAHGSFHRYGRAPEVEYTEFAPKRSGNRERKPASARGVPVDTDGKTSGAVAGSIPWEGFTRNRRSVWTIATQPFSGAHFATFPPALVEPCILAGSRPGDVVFDPFMGSGTVAQVAQRLGRQWLGCELNPDYLALLAQRTRDTMGMAL